MKVPTAVERAVLQAAEDRHQGRVDALDGHALFVREKFAYALALLDGRDDMTEDDWQLSGVAMQVSDHTRNWLVRAKAKADDEEAAKRGVLQGVSQDAAYVAPTSAEWERDNRIANWVSDKLNNAPTRCLRAS